MPFDVIFSTASLTGIAILLGASALAWALLHAYVRIARARAFVDNPNWRSSHSVPTPTGAGIVVVPIALAAWISVAWNGDAAIWIVGVAAFALFLIGWLDDRRPLPWWFRLLAQALATVGPLFLLGNDQLVFGGWLPLAADRFVTALAWIWFVNAYNFLDGIDGITGVQTVHLAIGLAIVMPLVGAADLDWALLGCAGAALGFLVHNWHPARVFLGDVGSIPIGYLLGYALVLCAADGGWAAALILPAYYWADATLTLLRRAARGKRLTEAHRDHFYQAPVVAGRPHHHVVCVIIVANLALMIAAAVVSSGMGSPAWMSAGWWLAWLLALVAVGAALGILSAWGRRPKPTTTQSERVR